MKLVGFEISHGHKKKLSIDDICTFLEVVEGHSAIEGFITYMSKYGQIVLEFDDGKRCTYNKSFEQDLIRLMKRTVRDHHIHKYGTVDSLSGTVDPESRSPPPKTAPDAPDLPPTQSGPASAPLEPALALAQNRLDLARDRIEQAQDQLEVALGRPEPEVLALEAPSSTPTPAENSQRPSDLPSNPTPLLGGSREALCYTLHQSEPEQTSPHSEPTPLGSDPTPNRHVAAPTHPDPTPLSSDQAPNQHVTAPTHPDPMEEDTARPLKKRKYDTDTYTKSLLSSIADAFDKVLS